MEYSLYIIYSPSLDRYYVGHTQDLDLRLEKHNSGYEISTKAGVPWTFKYKEAYPTRSEAMKREYEIKRKKSRKNIEWLITENG